MYLDTFSGKVLLGCIECSDVRARLDLKAVA